jgi:hypothetical protein
MGFVREFKGEALVYAWERKRRCYSGVRFSSNRFLDFSLSFIFLVMLRYNLRKLCNIAEIPWINLSACTPMYVRGLRSQDPYTRDSNAVLGLDVSLNLFTRKIVKFYA